MSAAALLSSPPSAVLVVSSDGAVLAASRQAGALAGRTEQALVGVPFSDLFDGTPEEARRFLERSGRADPSLSRLALRRPNRNASVALLCEATPLAGGSLLLRFEPSSSAASAGPPTDEGDWRSVLLTNLEDAVVVADRELTVAYMNPVAEALLGWTLEEAARLPLTQVLRLVDESTREPRTASLMAALRDDDGSESPPPLLVARDGRELPVEPQVLRPGVGVVVVLRPAGERQRLQRALMRSAEELAQRDRLKKEFLAMLGHELRNPLSATTNALQVLRLGSTDSDLLERAQAAAERQVRHMAQLVDGLLDVSRVTRGAIVLRKEQVDAAEVLESALDQARPAMSARNLSLSVTVSNETLMLEADRARLEQIMGNLLNNATRYTEPGGHVWVRLSREQGEIVLRVADDGVGISTDLLPKIFELFTQETRSLDRTGEGLGVGLTLVHSLVEMHGGHVTAHSEGRGRGSEFTVRLPTRATHTSDVSRAM